MEIEPWRERLVPSRSRKRVGRGSPLGEMEESVSGEVAEWRMSIR